LLYWYLICDDSERRIVAPLPQHLTHSAFSRGFHVRLITRHLATAALLAALSLTVPAVVGAGGPPSNAAVASASSVRIDNFGRVDEHYYRGAQPEGRDYADLAALGVKTVINLTSYDAEPNERSLTEQAGMSYVQIPMTGHEPPTAAQLAQFLGIVNDSARQPVYVHCVGGRHRTGVMTAAYRMATDGWTSDRAFREMKQYKFGFDFMHSEFKDFVFRYHPDKLAAAATGVTPGPPSREGRATRSQPTASEGVPPAAE
jgi:protein-tyrosine phosphatase